MWKSFIRKLESLHLTKLPPDQFGWGTEYLTRKTPVSPKEFLSSFVKKNLNESKTFFAYDPVKKFDLRNGILSFPAPLNYPHQTVKNKTTYAQVFPSRNSKKAVIVVPYWGASRKSYIGFCRVLASFGFTAVRLTLPYHEERGSPDWETTNELGSANIGRTIQAVRQAVVEVRALADWLKQSGYDHVGVMGTSFGSCIAFLADIHEPKITSLFAIHASGYCSDVIWESASTVHVKQGLKNNVTREELKQYWSIISPLPYIKTLVGKNPNHCIVTASHDITFPYHLTKEFFDEYERYHIPLKKKVFPVGHFTVGYAPFKYMVFKLLLNHFRETL